MTVYPKRLIEVDLPIKRISANARKGGNGKITGLHRWWARRPLGVCRAVACAASWPDPADEWCPPAFRAAAGKLMSDFSRQVMKEKSLTRLTSEESWNSIVTASKMDSDLDPRNTKDMILLRRLLLNFIADFSTDGASAEPIFLQLARALVDEAHQCMGNAQNTKPLFVDPFCGGGAIPLEAQRIGAQVYSSDLNAIPVLLNKVITEYIPNHGSKLSEKVRTLGSSIRDKLHQELRGFYIPETEIDTPFTYIWARTIRCEGPNCGYRFPLLRSMWLRQKPTSKVALNLLPNSAKKEVEADILQDVTNSKVKPGTSKLGAATCPECTYTTPVEQVRNQLSSRDGGAFDAQLLAVCYTKNGTKGKLFRKPTKDELARYSSSLPVYTSLKTQDDTDLKNIPDEPLNHLRGFFNVILYGMERWGDLLAPRQAILMDTLVRLIREECEQLETGDPALDEAIITCLALAVGRVSQYHSSCCRWEPKGESHIDMFARQALPMVWDFSEAYPFNNSTGDFARFVDQICDVIDLLVKVESTAGSVYQSSATQHPLPDNSADVFFTDPPYYDAIPYADLSDYFYVWLRRILRRVHPSMFVNDLSPKTLEIVSLAHRASMYRNKTPEFFETTMALAMGEAHRITKPDGIGVVVFANKSTTGWESMVKGLIEAGWVISASWPIETEATGRLRAHNSAVLTSSVHLVIRPRKNTNGSLSLGDVGDWREVLSELPKRIHEWLPRLAEENISGADAIFSCLGPALEIYSKYSRVEKASGELVSVEEYFQYVWEAVSREALATIFEGPDATGFEEDARLTAMWLWTISKGTSDSAHPESATNLTLEYDAARKIAQGLGAHLDRLDNIVRVKGDRATLLSVSERTRHLMDAADAASSTMRRRSRSRQLTLDGMVNEVNVNVGDLGSDVVNVAAVGVTVLDRVHQAMLLFASGHGSALRRFLVDDGVGRDERFWSLAQALAALYPSNTEEKRWVDGLLARKNGLGL